MEKNQRLLLLCRLHRSAQLGKEAGWRQPDICRVGRKGSTAARTRISTLLTSSFALSFQSPSVNEEGDSSSGLLMICSKSSPEGFVFF